MASTVAISAATNPIGEGRQRHAFYHAGRHWVFYCDGSAILWKSSTDAITWSAAQDALLPAEAGTMNNGGKFSIWLSKAQGLVHIVACCGSYNNALYYRAGTPNADGTITWVAAWNPVVPAVASVCYIYPHIITDSGNYAWVTYLHHPSTVGREPAVSKSGNHNGTWGTTPAGFPWKSEAPSSSNWRSVLVPMLSGKVALFRCCNMEDYIWNGAAWSSIETVGGHAGNTSMPAIADGDDLYCILVAANTEYTVRPWATGIWSAGTLITLDSVYGSVAIDPDTHDIYYVYLAAGTAHPSYMIYSSGVWTAGVEFEAESGAYIQTFYNPYDSVLGAVWMLGTSIRYVELPFGSPATRGGNVNSSKLFSKGFI
jgi:hypothetical protein